MENQIEKNIDCLKNSMLFRGLNAYEIEEFLLANYFKIIDLNRGEPVNIEPNMSLFVLSGAVATYENDAEGLKTFICLFEQNVNPMIPIWSKSSYPSITIEARKKSTVLLLSSDSFLKFNPSLLILQNKVQENVIEMLFIGSDDVVQRRRANAGSVSKDKIIKYLNQLKIEQKSNKLEISLTRQELADHLQMDVSTLMRELKKSSK